jgi:alpha-tubulin suppressor-like RCC1 family protein
VAAGYGQLGNGTTTPDRATPVDVVGLPSDVIALSHGYSEHTCARLSTGTARCWGQNDYGAQANGSVDRYLIVSTPATMTVVGGAEATGILDICAGMFLGCVLRDRGVAGVGEVLCAGADDYGQVGDGVATRVDVGRLQPVVDPSGGTLDDAVAVSCGRNHACAARSDGSVWCWGNDGYENLGNGLGTAVAINPTPMRVSGL